MNLSLPAFLEIALSLALIYLLLSLLASEIEEFIASFLQARARHLKKSIQIILGGTGKIEDVDETRNLQNFNDDEAKANKLTADFYQHSLISSLEQPSLGLKTRKHGPAYIPSETFASALLRIIEPYLKDVNSEKVQQPLDKISTVSLDVLNNAIENSVLPKTLRIYLSELATRAKINSESNKFKPELYQFQQEIKAWFERSQNRTSGAYKRTTKARLFLIGLVAAAIANADTFNIVNSLYNQPKTREAVTQAAVDVVNSCKENFNQDCDKKINNALSLDDLPIGWNNPPDTWANPWTIPGWLVSALAVTMGATFWFDLLKKFVNVRNAGPKPKSSDNNNATSNDE